MNKDKSGSTKHKIVKNKPLPRLPREFLENRFWLYFALAVALVLTFLFFDFKLSTGGDDATYVSLAKSLAEGVGYKDIWHPDHPPHTLVPPGYPALLVPLVFVFGVHYFPLKLLSIVFLLGGIWIFYLIIRERDPGLIGLLALLAFAFSPDLVEASHLILSDVPFLFAFVLTVFFFRKWEKEDASNWFYAAVASAVFCYYLRSAGVAVLAGALVYLIFRRKFKRALVFAGLAAVLIAPWVLRNAALPHSGGYLDQFLSSNPYDEAAPLIGFSELLQRLGHNLVIYWTVITPYLLFPPFFGLFEERTAVDLVMNVVLICIPVLIGLYKDLRRSVNIYHFLILFYFLMIIFWPVVWASARFLYPLYPFIIYFFFVGISYPGRYLRHLPAVAALIVAVAYLMIYIPVLPNQIRANTAYVGGNHFAGYTLDWVRYYEAAGWAKANTPPGSVMMCRKPHLFYLVSDRPSFGYPMTEDSLKILQAISEADYVILDNFFWTNRTQRVLYPILNEHIDWYTFEYTTVYPETYVLKVKEQYKKKTETIP